MKRHVRYLPITEDNEECIYIINVDQQVAAYYQVETRILLRISWLTLDTSLCKGELRYTSLYNRDRVVLYYLPIINMIQGYLHTIKRLAGYMLMTGEPRNACLLDRQAVGWVATCERLRNTVVHHWLCSPIDFTHLPVSAKHDEHYLAAPSRAIMSVPGNVMLFEKITQGVGCQVCFF